MKLAKLILLMLIVCFIYSERALGEYVPWDELTADWWIDFFDQDDPYMYPINAANDADIASAYPVSFVQATSDGKARGMNALKFIHGGQSEGHLVSSDKAGSFKIINTGDSNVFTNILLLIAIDTESLPNDFSMTINLEGQSPYTLSEPNFVYYDNFYGRPSGFYSATNPAGEPISYAFDTAMVCVYGVSGLTGLDVLGGTITIDYSFNDIPAPIVFSVYGYLETDPIPTIYHTNRAFIDIKNPSKKVSTFAVTVDGDLNDDLKVNLADLGILSRNWLVGVE
jgi:hypothetical protein